MPSAASTQCLPCGLRLMEHKLSLPFLYTTHTILRHQSSHHRHLKQTTKHITPSSGNGRCFSNQPVLRAGLADLEAYAASFRKGATKRTSQSSKTKTSSASLPRTNVVRDRLPRQTVDNAASRLPNPRPSIATRPQQRDWDHDGQNSAPSSRYAQGNETRESVPRGKSDPFSRSTGQDSEPGQRREFDQVDQMSWSNQSNVRDTMGKSKLVDRYTPRPQKNDDAFQPGRGRDPLHAFQAPQPAGGISLDVPVQPTTFDTSHARRQRRGHDVQSKSKSRPARESYGSEHLPFEAKKKNTIERTAKDTTITDAEAMTFQNLLGLLKPVATTETPDDQAMKEKDGPDTEDWHTVIGNVIGVNLRRPNAASTPRDLAPEHVDAATSKAAGVVRRVTSLMQDAQTDLRAWEILHEEAIDPVLALKLDEDDVAKDTEDGASQRPDKQLLVKTFPKLLVSFQEVLQQSFPSSAYALALLPYLRELGPSTFALGASTELYNHHIKSLHAQRTDLAAILETLREMHENVFEFDADTRSIVEQILHQSSVAAQSRNGRSCFWSGNIVKSTLEELQDWASSAEEELNDQALHATT